MEQQRGPTEEKCKKMRKLFPAFLAGELDKDVERRGRVRGHLMSCDACAVAFADMIAEAIERGQIAVEALPMPEPPSAVLNALGVEAHGGVVWQKVQEKVHQGIPWAEEMHIRMSRALDNVGEWLRPPTPVLRGPLRTRGALRGGYPEPAVGGAHIEISGLPDVECSLRIEILRPPTITTDGRFLLEARTSEAHLEGCYLDCTVEGEGGTKVTFEGELKREEDGSGWHVHIGADGLPAPDQDLVIPASHVEFHLRQR